MNISVFSSKKFLMPLRVMLFSFLEHNNFEKHNIFIVNTELDDDDIEQLDKDIYKNFKQHIVSLKINSDMQKLFMGKTRFREAAFYKLYMFRNLPINANRIMCLDADMVVRGSFKEFYYQDLGDKILAACKENEDFYNVKHMSELDIKSDEIYFNIGVLLIDLNKYLKAYEVEEYAKWYNNNIESAIYVAQDIINIFFKNKIKLCDNYTYNNQIIFSSKFTESEIEKMKQEVKLLHYVGQIKPDDYRYECELRHCYTEILKEYGFTGELIKININRIIKRNLTRCKHLLDKIKRR